MDEPPTSNGAWLRFQFYVAGVLVATDWLDCLADVDNTHADYIKERHVALQLAAEDQDETWMIEIYDPDEEPGHQYIRMGTDSSMMHQPVAATRDEVAELIKAMRSELEA